MEAIKFRLSGRTAFFKKPDVNSYLYFTYGQIHKVALLGILGSIIGCKGYNQMTVDEKYPEFYEKLRGLRIGIEPLGSKGVFSKKLQIFNNSVGYASKEQGGNLIVKEQWLENPSWNIYILLDCDEAIRIKDYLINMKCEFIPYLGKNDHVANIDNIKISEVNNINGIVKIDSIFEEGVFTGVIDEEMDDLYEEIECIFKYKESLPKELSNETNLYKYATFIYTNGKILVDNEDKVFEFENKSVYFY